MDKKRKAYLDSLWRGSAVGKWSSLLAQNNRKEADELMEKIFQSAFDANGNIIRPDAVNPYNYLIDQEKQLCDVIKSELKNKKEGKDYVMALDIEDSDLMDIMVAYEFSILNLYYEDEK